MQFQTAPKVRSSTSTGDQLSADEGDKFDDAEGMKLKQSFSQRRGSRRVSVEEVIGNIEHVGDHFIYCIDK